MSYKYLKVAWEAADLPTPARFVLVSLADQSNDEGVCWPAVRSLIARTGLSERAVRSAVKLLMERGYLEKEARFKDNLQRSNVYTLRGAPPAPTPCTTCTPWVQDVHPENHQGTFTEPSLSPCDKSQGKTDEPKVKGKQPSGKTNPNPEALTSPLPPFTEQDDKMATAAEVMKQFKDEKSKPPSMGIHLSAKMASLWWVKARSYYYPSETMDGLSLTQKETNALGSLVKKCRIGEKQHAKAVLARCMAGWQTFIWHLKSQKGIDGPKIPSPLFLLAHLDVALPWATAVDAEMAKAVQKPVEQPQVPSDDHGHVTSTPQPGTIKPAEGMTPAELKAHVEAKRAARKAEKEKAKNGGL